MCRDKMYGQLFWQRSSAVKSLVLRSAGGRAQVSFRWSVKVARAWAIRLPQVMNSRKQPVQPLNLTKPQTEEGAFLWVHSVAKERGVVVRGWLGVLRFIMTARGDQGFWEHVLYGGWIIASVTQHQCEVLSKVPLDGNKTRHLQINLARLWHNRQTHRGLNYITSFHVVVSSVIIPVLSSSFFHS